MIHTRDILDGIWGALGAQEEREALEWMGEMLEQAGRMVFADTDDLRKYALDNTDLVEPEEE